MNEEMIELMLRLELLMDEYDKKKEEDHNEATISGLHEKKRTAVSNV